MVEQAFLWRFELYLPLTYNDGRRIEDEKVDRMFTDLEDKFGGYTTSPRFGGAANEGYYLGDDGKTYRDRVYIVMIDAPQEREVIRFFEQFRQKCKKRFNQTEIYITFHPIERIV